MEISFGVICIITYEYIYYRFTVIVNYSSEPFCNRPAELMRTDECRTVRYARALSALGPMTGQYLLRLWVGTE